MKVAYIAHPIGGDVKGNLEKIVKIGRDINLSEPNVIPFAPYFFDCHCLNDDIPEERERGIKNDIALFKMGFISELRLYGDRISNGMRAEIKLCKELNIPIKAMTRGTNEQYNFE
jgi:hypothetical protein